MFDRQARFPTLAQILTRTGGFVSALDPISPDSFERRISGVSLYEGDQRARYRGHIVLMLEAPAELSTVFGQDSSLVEAVAIVTPTELQESPAWADGQHSPVLLRKSHWGRWTEIFTILSDLIGVETPSIDSGFQGDLSSLSELANWLSLTTRSSITIEDLDSRVLAYSVDGEALDDLRHQTILTGGVPGWRVKQLMETGFLPAVWNSEDVIEREADRSNPARTVVTVRTSNRAIATIWAVHSDMTDRLELREALRSAARIAAPLILQQRNRSLYEDRAARGALEAIISGRTDRTPAEAGLQYGREYAVLAATLPSDRGVTDLLFHLRGKYPDLLATDAKNILHVVIPAEPSNDIATSLTAFFARVLPRAQGRIGVGRAVPADKIVHSAEEARLVMRAMWAQGARTSSPTPESLEISDRPAVEDMFALLRVADLAKAARDDIIAPVSVLQSIDDRQGSNLVGTLASYLHGFGNVAESARALNIHSNSLRQRLTRIRELTRIDPTSPDARARLMLAIVFLENETANAQIAQYTGNP